MNETTLAQTITDLAEPLAASLGLDIWGVEAQYGKRSVIRIYVEGQNGVDIDKCAELSRLLGLTLDVEDIVPAAYVLEVSSPGLERTFFTPEQLGACLGKTVEVALHSPGDAYPGRKKLLGLLTGVSGGTFSVVPLDAPEDDPRPASFAWEDIKKAKLVHFLPEAPKAVKGKKPKQAKPPKEKKNAAGEEDEAVS